MLSFQDLKKLKGEDFDSLEESDKLAVEHFCLWEPEQYEEFDAELREAHEQWRGPWRDAHILEPPTGARKGNPLYAWFAWAFTREYDLPTPVWVLDYFDGCAASMIMGAFNEKLPSVAVAVPKALGFKGARGPSEFSRFRKDGEGLKLAKMVARWQLGHGDSVNKTIKIVSRVRRRDRKTVKAAYDRNRDYFRGTTSRKNPEKNPSR